jgi:hypothetical protein
VKLSDEKKVERMVVKKLENGPEEENLILEKRSQFCQI